MAGWVAMERDALEKIGWQNSELIALYCWLLSNAAYTARSEAVDGMEIELRPGDTVVTRSRLAAAMRAPEATCYHRLKRLSGMGLIDYAYTPGAKHSIVTIPGPDGKTAENINGSIGGSIDGDINGSEQGILNLNNDNSNNAVDGNVNGNINGNVGGVEGARVRNKETNIYSKKEINKEKKLDNALLLDQLRNGLNNLFHRRPTTVWSDKEAAKLAKIGQRPDALEEFRLIDAHYRSGYRFAHKAIETLLNNWTTACDRAASDGFAANGDGEVSRREARSADAEYGF